MTRRSRPSCICEFSMGNCGGLGTLDCIGCGGGNLCVCAACFSHGEIECPGCDMCSGCDGDDGGDYSDEEPGEEQGS